MRASLSFLALFANIILVKTITRNIFALINHKIIQNSSESNVYRVVKYLPCKINECEVPYKPKVMNID